MDLRIVKKSLMNYLIKFNMKTQQVIFFILFALFLLLGGFSIIKYENNRENRTIKPINEKIIALEKKFDDLSKKKEICDINFKNCKENLKTCQKDKEDFFKNLNKKND